MLSGSFQGMNPPAAHYVALHREFRPNPSNGQAEPRLSGPKMLWIVLREIGNKGTAP
jgi:hypothetical protein